MQWGKTMLKCLLDKQRSKNKRKQIKKTKQIMIQLVHEDWIRSLNRCRPHMLSQPGLHLVILRLRTGRSSDGRVGEVHMRRHGAGIRRSTGVRVGEVVGRTGRRDAMRGGRPTQTRHVWAPADAVRAVVVVGRWLQWLRRTVARGM